MFQRQSSLGCLLLWVIGFQYYLHSEITRETFKKNTDFWICQIKTSCKRYNKEVHNKLWEHRRKDLLTIGKELENVWIISIAWVQNSRLNKNFHVTQGLGSGDTQKEILKIWTVGRACAVTQRHASKGHLGIYKNSNSIYKYF